MKTDSCTTIAGLIAFASALVLLSAVGCTNDAPTSATQTRNNDLRVTGLSASLDTSLMRVTLTWHPITECSINGYIALRTTPGVNFSEQATYPQSDTLCTLPSPLPDSTALFSVAVVDSNGEVLGNAPPVSLTAKDFFERRRMGSFPGAATWKPLDTTGCWYATMGSTAFARADSTGRQVYLHDFGGMGIRDYAVDLAGNAYVVSNGSTSNSTRLTKLDASGSEMWHVDSFPQITAPVFDEMGNPFRVKILSDLIRVVWLMNGIPFDTTWDCRTVVSIYSYDRNSGAKDTTTFTTRDSAQSLSWIPTGAATPLGIRRGRVYAEVPADTNGLTCGTYSCSATKNATMICAIDSVRGIIGGTPGLGALMGDTLQIKPEDPPLTWPLTPSTGILKWLDLDFRQITSPRDKALAADTILTEAGYLGFDATGRILTRQPYPSWPRVCRSDGTLIGVALSSVSVNRFVKAPYTFTADPTNCSRQVLTLWIPLKK